MTAGDDRSEALETMAAELEASGQHRVLRKLQPRTRVAPAEGAPVRTGLFVDVETTGLDPARCEIIELAMTPFTYGLDGRIFDIGEAFHKLREPAHPIPPQVTALTGITDAMVAGQTIAPAEVTAFAAPAALVVAHNAAFDRRFLERFCDVFTTKPWACSMTQVDWQSAGYEGLKLSHLAAQAGFFYDRHRAVHDCLAAVELLALPLPGSDAPALQRLLATARTPTWRIWAENAPYDLKDALKARGYRWNADRVGGPRAWYVDVAEDSREAELAFLKQEIYRGEIELLVPRIDAYDRFSERV